MIITSLFVAASILIIVVESIQSLEMNDKYFEIFEIVYAVWFTLDLVARFFSSPSLKTFFKSLYNIIDLFIYSLFLLLLLLPENQYVVKLKMIARVCRVFAFLRILKYTTGLQTLSDTLKNSRKEMTFYVFYLMIAVLIFSSIVYAFEGDQKDTEFYSIPNTFWVILFLTFYIKFCRISRLLLIIKFIRNTCVRRLIINYSFLNSD